MFRQVSVLVSVILTTSLLAADLSEKWSKRLESADVAYQSAVQKADNVRFHAVQKANQDRVKVLKTALVDATKAGDFDTATEIKARLSAAESTGVRKKPKNVTKFGTHEYALIEEQATWHVAKRRCEEIGGHLAIIDSPQESQFLISLCGKHSAWAGASDEETEGDWAWVDGTSCPEFLKATWRLTDETSEFHNLVWWLPDQQWAAGKGNGRVEYLCEWE